MRVILASTSVTRQSMLKAAGVLADTESSGVDEAPIKHAGTLAGQSAAVVAARLAREKALAVSARHPDAVVIGADQMLDCEGTWFDKPADREEAAQTLHRLSGRMHRLETSIACVRDGEVTWFHGEAPRLTMRPLSDAFITAYLAAEGEAALHSVGAYRLEGPGIQLFERIEGDFFTILGLPLLPLLGYLRQIGALPS
ncbi:nucleoside triphosphate pyrophosphatase [Acidiphilium sp.]|uniref:Maf family protein n=1 Tax=Acidiphilium sp. TaxID=527 RepID=UPI00259075BC|nr:nucleoside triphosphate pyrophosphatase [Acidiphilium sp.]